MSQEFVPEDNSFVSPALPDDRPNSDSALSEQEVVRISVVGSRKIVLETIHTLYRLGFAAVGDWSKLQPPTAGTSCQCPHQAIAQSLEISLAS